MPKPVSLLILVGILWLGLPALAQPKVGASNPQDKPRKIKDEPNDAFKKWLIDVGPILSPEEISAWTKLQNNEEREHFILRAVPEPE